MLNTEEIKKACEFAEGFELDLSGERIGEIGIICESSTNPSCRELFNFRVPDGKHLSANRFIYDLFLQRIVEGINKEELDSEKPCFKVRSNCDTSNQWYEVSHGRVLAGGHSWIEKLFKNRDSIDQSKEQAIKYILEAIK